MTQTQKKLLITLIVLLAIGYLRLDTILIGGNFIWTAFFILLGLGLMFNQIEERDREVQVLRYRLHQSIFGNTQERDGASSYAVSNRLLLDMAKRELEKQYGK